MVNPESSSNESRETPHYVIDDVYNHRNNFDADVLRRRREKALAAVGSCHQSFSNSNPCSSSDTSLRTPLIDISSLGSDSSGNGDNPQRSSSQHQHLESNTHFSLAPEAALHRDGEQARLVEAVRRRQIQQRQRNEESSYQWLEDSATQFWESILVYGGFRDDPRNTIPVDRGVHSTMPTNPYRSHSRQGLNHGEIIQTGRNCSFDSKTKEQLTDHPIGNDPPSNLQRTMYLVLCNILQVLYVFIDFCITRLAPSEHLQHCAVASAAPSYNIQISVGDILRFWVIQCAFLIFSSWMQVFAFPMVIMICLTIGSVSRKMVRSPLVMNPRHERGRSSVTTTTEIPSIVSAPDTSFYPTNSRHRESTIQKLQRNNPGATSTECSRFLTAVKHDEEAASKRIREFLQWRSDCGLKSTDEVGDSRSHADNANELDGHARVFDRSFAKKDEDDWNASAKKAISIVTKSHILENMAKLPQIICSYEEKFAGDIRAGNSTNPSKVSSQPPPPRCNDGTRILHILPARLDLSIATAQTYSLAIALYLDRRLCRWTTERITLICDVRGGRGWANPTPWSTLPFIQSTASLLGSNYPERLERLVLFPMPMSASWVWSAARKCLDPNTSSKVVVLSSGDNLREKLKDFVDEVSFNVLEERRRCSFVTMQR